MFVIYMISWWYGRGWAWAISRTKSEILSLGKSFEVKILLKTLFAPWKQITSTGRSLTFFQRLADNTVSRMIGFIIRFFILIFVAIVAIVEAVFSLAILILWPFMPLSILILPILTISGAGN